MTEIKEDSHITRREFIGFSINTAISLSFVGNLIHSKKGSLDWRFLYSPENTKEETLMSIVEGKDIYKATRRAIVLAGGLEGIVKLGDSVLIKPNMAFDKAPEYGATTHPDVVRAVIDAVFDRGAEKVYLVDNTVENERASYERSRIKDIGDKSGADVIYFNERDTEIVNIENADVLKSVAIHRLCLECDAIINVPVAKTHNLSVLSLSIKNLMGLVGGERWRWHKNIAKYLADFYSYLLPSFTVLDASRVLLANGPSGGNLNDVRWQNTILASRDGIACDAYATSFFGLSPTDIDHIRECADRGLGEIDLSKVKILKEAI